MYVSKIDQIKNFTENISEFIMEDSDFIVDANHKSFVRLDKFNDSSIDILVYTFTNTNNWKDFLKIKEDLAFNIKEIVESNKASLAFPSTSIYIEKNQK